MCRKVQEREAVMIGKGAWLGTKTGFILAAIYTGIAALLISSLRIDYILLVLFYGFLWGVLPASIIGMVTGVVVAAFVTLLNDWFPTAKDADSRAILAMGFGTVFAVIVGLVFFNGWFGFIFSPIYIYIIASGWMGYKLSRTAA